MLCAAYGSNLDPRQMAERCPHSPERGNGWLLGWRMTFGGEGWDGALPTMAEDADAHVFVALYDVTPADESTLAEWMGHSIEVAARYYLTTTADTFAKVTGAAIGAGAGVARAKAPKSRS